MEYTAEYWLSASEAVHFSTNNTVQGEVTHRRSIIIHIVITVLRYTKFYNIFRKHTTVTTKSRGI